MQAQGGALLTLIGKAGKETPLDAEHADICVLAHFPVCNVRYALKDDSGAIVWLRVFTPILPGDAETSNTPGAVFEVSAEKFDGQVRVDIALAHNVEPVVKPLELGGGGVGAGRRYFKGSDYRASFTLQSFDRDGTAEASDERVRLAITAPSRQASRGGRCSRGTCRGGSTPAASRT